MSSDNSDGFPGWIKQSQEISVKSPHIPIVDHNRKFVWFMVPKAATRTLKKVLFNTSHTNPRILGRNKRRLELNEICRNAKAVKPRRRAMYARYFTFTFVRNPWDRIYSTYKNKIVASKDHLPWFNRWDKYSFSDFLQYLEKHPTLLDQNRHTAQQIILTCNMQNVDFLGRFEYLEGDITRLLTKLHRRANKRGPLPKIEATLPQLNSTTDGWEVSKFGEKPESWFSDWREAYEDGRLVDIVENLYKADIKTFGYKFD